MMLVDRRVVSGQAELRGHGMPPLWGKKRNLSILYVYNIYIYVCVHIASTCLCIYTLTMLLHTCMCIYIYIYIYTHISVGILAQDLPAPVGHYAQENFDLR